MNLSTSIHAPLDSGANYQGQRDIALRSLTALVVAVFAYLAATSAAKEVLGADAWPWVFISLVAFLLAGITGLNGLRDPSRLLGIAARASALMVVVRSVFDASGQSTLSQLRAQGVSAVGSLVGLFGETMAFVGMFVLIFIVIVVAALYSQYFLIPKADKRGSFLSLLSSMMRNLTTATFGSGWRTRFWKIGLLPLIGFMIGSVVVLVARTVSTIGLWVFYGLVAFGIGINQEGTNERQFKPDARSSESWASRLRERLSGHHKATFQDITVYRNVIHIERRDGQVVQQSERHWRIGKDADPGLAELRELAEAVVTAYDSALNSSNARYTSYTLDVSRAWTESGQHALVLKIAPPPAAEDAAKLTPAKIIPTIDSHSGWSSDELDPGLNLSARLRESAYREGQTGLFITLARSGSNAADGQPTVAVFEIAEGVLAKMPESLQELLPRIGRAISETGLTGRLSLAEYIDDQEADVLEFHARQGIWQNFEKWQELGTTWHATTPRMRHHTSVDGVQMILQLEPKGLLLSFPKPPAQFPSGDAMLWRPFIEQHLETLHHTPLRFPIGVDRNSETVYGELSSDTPAWLIAGEPGSGKSAGVVVPMLASLCAASKPTQLKLTLIDSTKCELLDVYGFSDDPHILRAVSSREGTTRVLDVLDAFLADMDAAYKRYSDQKRHFNPRHDVAHVLMIEELADLFALTPTPEALRVLHTKLQRVVQVGRGAGYYLVATIQLPKANLLPTEIRSLFGARIVGYYTEAGSYRIALDEHRRFFDTKIAGRMVVRGALDHGDTYVQTYYLPAKDCLKFIAEQREMYGLSSNAKAEDPCADASTSGEAAHSGYRPLDPNAGDEPAAPRRRDPIGETPESAATPTSDAATDGDTDDDRDIDADSARCPTQTEIRRFSEMTAWRIITRHAVPGNDVSRDIVIKWIRAENLTAPGTNQIQQTLKNLMHLDLLEFVGQTMSRRMNDLTWSQGAAKIAKAEIEVKSKAATEAEAETEAETEG